MPQYRKLATKTLESFDFNALTDDFSRLTWCLLPLVACRNGRGIDIPSWLIGKLYPLRQDVTPAMIEAAMSDFAAHNMIVRYSVEGRRYFQIVNWARYQGATDKEAASPYPAPELVGSGSGVGRELVDSKSASDADADTNANTGGIARETTTPQPATPPPSPPPVKVKSRSQSTDRPPGGNGYQPPPEPEPPPKREPTPDELAVGKMANAITDVTGVSARMNWDKVGGLASELVAEGYTADQVHRHYGREPTPGAWNWYSDDWRGKPPRNERPGLNGIRETIAGAVHSGAVEPARKLSATERGLLLIKNAKLGLAGS